MSNVYPAVKGVIENAGYAVEAGDLCGLACYPSGEPFVVYVVDPAESASENLSPSFGWTVTVTDYDVLGPDTTYETATYGTGVEAVLAALNALKAPDVAAAAAAVKGGS